MTQPTEAPVIPEQGTIGVLEAAFATAVLAAFTAWLARVSAALFAAPFINPVTIWSFIPAWEREVDGLITLLAKIAKMGWDAAARDLQGEGVIPPFDVSNAVVQDQLRRTRNFMVDTPNEVYRMVLSVLDKNAGDKLAQQAAVRNILDITGTVNWPARAKTVAVTEVNRAFHFGSLALAMQTPGMIVKKWIAREDGATRPTHAAADNQLQPVFQPFLVGVSLLQAPSDPAGPPHEVISCRCTLSYTRGRE